MDLYQAIETTNTCRFFKKDAVPRDVLRRALTAARFAPSGGNRQPVRFVVVTDPGLKKELAALYLPHWKQYIGGMTRGDVRVDTLPAMVRNADYFANHLAEVPALVVVCARLADCYATDTQLGRLSVVGGASIYPAVQNFILGCRAEGLGTALTTLLVAEEPKVRPLLGLPDDISTAAFIAVGYPEKPFPKQLRRKELAEMCFADRYGQAF
ncbi:MAG TPA: nitroreductase family protein [Myxococcota bacterium]|nr:nitroreductase family protein [Myxococcota bacterium]